MGITIRDVAEHAGVSIATVSRVINNDPGHRINPDTARKVIDAVIALGYSPDGMARNLRKVTTLSQTSLNIGTLLTSTIDSYSSLGNTAMRSTGFEKDFSYLGFAKIVAFPLTSFYNVREGFSGFAANTIHMLVGANKSHQFEAAIATGEAVKNAVGSEKV